MSSYKSLLVYEKGFKLAMEIFKLTKTFPKDEIYGLTSQIRRSSRAVCSNLAEAYRKRRYENHFISKLTDCDSENSETQVWLDFSISCQYIDETTYNKHYKESEEIGRLIQYMIENPNKFRQ